MISSDYQVSSGSPAALLAICRNANSEFGSLACITGRSSENAMNDAWKGFGNYRLIIFHIMATASGMSPGAIELVYEKCCGDWGLVGVGMPKFGSVRFFQNFAERRTGLYVRSGKFCRTWNRTIGSGSGGSSSGSAEVRTWNRTFLFENTESVYKSYIDYLYCRKLGREQAVGCWNLWKRAGSPWKQVKMILSVDNRKRSGIIKEVTVRLKGG